MMLIGNTENNVDLMYMILAYLRCIQLAYL